MSTEAAQLTLAAITLVGTVVWLISLQFLVLTYRKGKSRQSASAFSLDNPEQLPDDWFLGSADVDGQPSALLDKAVAILARQSALQPGAFGPLKITERTASRVAFERVGPMLAHQPFHQGRLMFTSLGNARTRIDFAVELARGRWLLRLGWAFLAAGFLALSLGCWAIYVFCVSSNNPAVRVQAVQMVQCVHFLWPPFLFGGLYRHRMNSVLSSFEALVHNLPYLE